MEKDALIAALKAKFPEVAEDASPNNLPCVLVPQAQYRALAEFLKADKALDFDFPMSLTAIDWPERKVITGVLHLYSMSQKHKLVVKVDLDRDKPGLPTVSDLWRGCEWFEREAYDMFGVVYENHPDLRRILLTDDWVGFPLRKDYKDSRIAGKPF